MLYRETIDLYYKQRKRHVHIICVENTEFLTVRTGDMYRYHYALMSENSIQSQLFFLMARQPLGGLGRFEASRSHTLDTPHSAGLL
jgi:hypothetical protein